MVCPNCSRVVIEQAIRCRVCGFWLYPAEIKLLIPLVFVFSTWLILYLFRVFPFQAGTHPHSSAAAGWSCILGILVFSFLKLLNGSKRAWYVSAISATVLVLLIYLKLGVELLERGAVVTATMFAATGLFVVYAWRTTRLTGWRNAGVLLCVIVAAGVLLQLLLNRRTERWSEVVVTCVHALVLTFFLVLLYSPRLRLWFGGITSRKALPK